MQTYIIAEAGVNHNGSESLALEMITAAKKSGADAIKFQLFQADTLVTLEAEQAEYQKKSGVQAQYEMLKALELPPSAFRKLYAYAQSEKIDFIITPFDIESLLFVSQDLKLPIIKIGSGDITNGPLLLEAGRSQKHVILSTGMCTLGEIEAALKVLAYGYLEGDLPTREKLDHIYAMERTHLLLKEKITLLHCTSEYPAPVEEVNLRAMDTLSAAFGIEVGLSDHTLGITVPLAAVARGAKVIEKHFTLDKKMSGPDHTASLNPQELMLMIEGIRNIEKALGNGKKYLTYSEKKNIKQVRRALVADKKMKKGELFSKENIGVKRPFHGLSPMCYWDLLGKAAQKDYEKDETILC